MEIANLWANADGGINNVRIACREDAQAITSLLRRAAYAHLHADWHYPSDWLGSSGFVVLESEVDDQADRSLASRLFGAKPQLQACLAVASDPPPAAWVRVAAVAKSAGSPRILAALFASVIDYLHQEGVTKLGWLQVESWPEEWLRDLGFQIENFVETYVKQDVDIFAAKEMSGLVIRPVQEVDLPLLERIEADAFEPLWRHSVTSLTLAWRHALSFDVAALNDEVVGYQFSTPVESGAHLARVTVAPFFQGSGVGTRLLAHAFEGYRRRGLNMISLNTQADNSASKKLYQRFGFRPNGQRFPVWAVDL